MKLEQTRWLLSMITNVPAKTVMFLIMQKEMIRHNFRFSERIFKTLSGIMVMIKNIWRNVLFLRNNLSDQRESKV